MFRDYPWRVEITTRYCVPFVGFTTNGQLLSKAAFERMVALDLDEITGVNKDTNEDLMPGAEFDRLHAALALTDRVRKKLHTRTNLRLNYTVCPKNLDARKGFFDVYGQYRIDRIEFRPITDFGETVYTDKDPEPLLDQYDATIDSMIAYCNARRISLLANRMASRPARPNPAAAPTSTASCAVSIPVLSGGGISIGTITIAAATSASSAGAVSCLPARFCGRTTRRRPRIRQYSMCVELLFGMAR